MKVGLLDVDGHNFPNIPLMKLSAWHKAQGDEVEMYFPFYHYDRVYVSKVFSFTPDFPYKINADEVYRGGSGYAISLVDGREVYDKSADRNLPEEVEHTMPDYSLYGITDHAYGFTSRGCPRGCPFCHVAAKEGRASVKHADVTEFWNGQKYIQCCDPNLLACKDKADLLDQYAQTKALVEFNQGLDMRLMTDMDIEALRKIRIKELHFAWDNPNDDLSERFRAFAEGQHGIGDKHGRNGTVFCLTNFEDVSLQEHIDRLLPRIYKLRELNYAPYVMIYDKAHAPHELKKIARWCNNKYIFYQTERYEEYDGKR